MKLFKRLRRKQPPVQAPVHREDETTSDKFIFGATEPSTNMATMRLPSDPLEMARLYRGIRKPRNDEERIEITYDPAHRDWEGAKYLPPLGKEL